MSQELTVKRKDLVKKQNFSESNFTMHIIFYATEQNIEISRISETALNPHFVSVCWVVL